MIDIPTLTINLHDFVSTPDIPQPDSAEDACSDNPSLQYNGTSFADFSTFVENFYDESRYWRNNIFPLPPGQASKKFMDIQTHWIQQFNFDTPYRKIALTTVLILPNLLLQKPSGSSKVADHRKLLERRLECWEKGELEELKRDGLVIQRKLLSSRRKEPSASQLFARHMLQGKLNAATRLLEKDGSGGILPFSDAVTNALKDKHPEASPVMEGSLLHGPVNDVPPSFYDSIDEKMVCRAIRYTKGAAGPSNISGQFMQHYCHKKFNTSGQLFREAVAHLARKVSSTHVHPAQLASFTACKLIPLDKRPGVRPIGVGEILRRIVGKCVSWVVKEEVKAAAGPLQVASGVKSGAEGAIHAMRDLFHDEESEGIILIDASNAFNRLNRASTLHNARILCPEVATYLINTYRVPTSLIIQGDHNTGEELWSYEGTVQGDNLGMHFYCLGTLPLITRLHHHVGEKNCKQCWLADDATAVGSFHGMRMWFDKLLEIGYQYGYFVNQSKTWLIIKDPANLERAKEAFQGTDVQFTTEGKRHLGACIGSESYKKEYCDKIVKQWCDEVENLCDIAKYHPHAAYANYIHSYQHKYTYFLRTIPGFEHFVKPLDDLVTYGLLPTLFGSPLTQLERKMVALPTRHGGLGIQILCERAQKDFATSMKVTSKLTAAIKEQSFIAQEICHESIKKAKVCRESEFRNTRDELMREVTPPVKRVLEIISEKGASSWLNALPLKSQGFVLNKTEFTDALNLRYFRELRGLRSNCPCGQKFTVTHALNCKRGGFVHMRHDSIRDLLAKLLGRVQNDVETEPPLLPTPEETASENTSDGARLDIRARGFWRDGQHSFFDVRVFNPLSATSLKTSLKLCYSNQEREKKRAYNNRVMQNEGGTFTPLVFTVFGTASRECSNFLKTLSLKLDSKSNDKNEDAMCWLRCKISFLCIKHLGMCVRGSRNSDKKVYVSSDFESDIVDARL